MKHALRTYAPPVISGVLLAIAFPSWHLFPLAWVAIALIAYQDWGASPRVAAFRFFLAGFAFHLVLLQWLLANVYWAGGWAALAHGLLSAALALYWAAMGWAWAMTSKHIPRFAGALSLAVLWVAMEHLQARLFTGFGWSALAYSQGPDLWLSQWAAVGGTALVAFFVVFVSVCAAGVFRTTGRKRYQHIAAGVGVLVLAHIGGLALMSDAEYGEEPFMVGMIQANFPLEMKWDPEYTVEMVANTAEKSRTLAQFGPLDLIVWPESLIMDEIEIPEIKEEVTSLAVDTESTLFLGAHRSEPGGGATFNSSYLLRPDGTIDGHYDKIHLAPFGEYAPFSDVLPFIAYVVPAIGNLEHGTEPKTFEVGDRTLGPLICFEVLFASMAETLRNEGADFLTVITNLGWFGRSNALGQELEMARLRAIETRLPLVHCANTGISGVFDPYGRFSGARHYFDGNGDVFLIPDELSPHRTRQFRIGGRLPLAKPAARATPISPGYFGWLASGVAVTMVAAATWMGRKGSREVSAL